jgi:hypothetical protein
VDCLLRRHSWPREITALPLFAKFFSVLILACFWLSFRSNNTGKEWNMKKHILSGIVIGGIFGIVVAWFAMVDAVPEGGVLALAGAFDGIMAGLGVGWLIGVNVAEGTIDEAGEELAHLAPSGELAEAHA